MDSTEQPQDESRQQASETQEKASESQEAVSGTLEQGKEKASESQEAVSGTLEQGKETAGGVLEEGKERISQAAESVTGAFQSTEGGGERTASGVAGSASETWERGRERTGAVVDTGRGYVDSARATTEDASSYVREKLTDVARETQHSVKAGFEKIERIFGSGETPTEVRPEKSGA